MNPDTEVTDYKIFGHEYHNSDKMIEIYVAYNTSHPTIKSSFNTFCLFNEELELYEFGRLDNKSLLNLLLEDKVIIEVDNKYYLKKSSLLMLI